MKVKIDRAGRIVLPKAVREKLSLAPGDALELEQSEDRVTLIPAREGVTLRKKHGFWVVHTGEPLSEETVRETLGRVRSERERRVHGSALE